MPYWRVLSFLCDGSSPLPLDCKVLESRGQKDGFFIFHLPMCLVWHMALSTQAASTWWLVNYRPPCPPLAVKPEPVFWPGVPCEQLQSISRCLGFSRVVEFNEVLSGLSLHSIKESGLKCEQQTLWVMFASSTNPIPKHYQERLFNRIWLSPRIICQTDLWVAS